MYQKALKELTGSAGFTDKLHRIYGQEEAESQSRRYQEAVRRFGDLFGDALPDAAELHLFRAPGRTEICGNHTDHQRGEVLAAAITKDVIAVAAKNGTDEEIRIFSEGFGEILSGPAGSPKGSPAPGSPASLVFGIRSQLLRRGYRAGGFTAYLTSSVPEGAGLSSSAAFETVIAMIFSGLFNQLDVPAEEIARIGQKAETECFGKPCGMMDQMASAAGGICHMDFSDPQKPVLQQIPLDPAAHGYCLCIVTTGSSHANLTDDYAAIPRELGQVAAYFGRDVVRDISEETLIREYAGIRRACSDRAFLRALHVIRENERVRDAVRVLNNNDFDSFLELIRQSGRSSMNCLQNIYSDRQPLTQPLSAALAISESVLGTSGVCRVHGGGFAGTIQAFVRLDALDRYQAVMDRAFGEGACHVCRISPAGGTQLL